MGSSPPLSMVRRFVIVTAVTLTSIVLSVGGSSVAHAHTGFESSTPSDGATVDAPVELITIVFTGAATPVGDEFVALTPEGVVQQPVRVETVDDKVFSLAFDPPLVRGQVGVRWHVQAADAHPIEGSFSFVVAAPAPPIPQATPPVTGPPTTKPPSASVATMASVEATPETAIVDVLVQPVDDSAAVDTETAGPKPPPSADTEAAAEGIGASTPQSLDEFLAVDNSTPGETTAIVGRLVGLLGIVVGVGSFSFVATALRGRRDELRRVLLALRVLGVFVIIGAAIEYVGVGRVGAASLGSTWSTAPGFATVLRAFGGIGLALGIAGALTTVRSRPAGREPSTARSVSAAAVDDLKRASTQPDPSGSILRWVPNARSWPAITGVVLVVASFWFDGHTVSKGFRPLHALVNSVHVLAGSVWVGGIVTLAAVVWSRHRLGEPKRVAELVIRFSKIATIALALVVIAGGVMAVLVLDSFGELTGSPWGKMLLLKTAAVGLAMIGGAYNHFRLLPALESDRGAPELLASLRSTVTAEAILLVFVVAVTAWLVSAA